MKNQGENQVEKKVLAGGRENKIFQEGKMVIRPANPWTPSIHAFLKWMRSEGADFVPIPYESTREGEERLSYMPGEVYQDELPEMFFKDEMLQSAAKLLKQYHQYSQRYVKNLTGKEVWMLPAVSPVEVLCHGDFAPYNVAVKEGKATYMFDFDTLHPGPRLWDIVYAVYRFVPFTASSSGVDRENLKMQIRRTKLFLDTYGVELEERQCFVALLVQRLNSLMDYMKTEARAGNKDFQRNIQEGHLEVYLRDISYLENNQEEILSAL